MNKTKNKFVKRYPRAVVKLSRRQLAATYYLLHTPSDRTNRETFIDWEHLMNAPQLHTTAARDVAELRSEPS